MLDYTLDLCASCIWVWVCICIQKVVVGCLLLARHSLKCFIQKVCISLVFHIRVQNPKSLFNWLIIHVTITNNTFQQILVASSAGLQANLDFEVKMWCCAPFSIKTACVKNRWTFTHIRDPNPQTVWVEHKSYPSMGFQWWVIEKELNRCIFDSFKNQHFPIVIGNHENYTKNNLTGIISEMVN